MSKSSNPFKGKRAGRIINLTFVSIVLVLFASTLSNFTSYKDPPLQSFVILFGATILFVIAILAQSILSINTEKRIDELEKRIEKLEKSNTD